MDKLKDALSMMLVGAFWGCTNPMLRRASIDSTAENTSDNFFRATIKKFVNVRVWLPYILNQFGSVLFYIQLSKSDLTLAVPICNGLALVFSFITSFLLGEPINKPTRTVLGASLVVAGVAICLTADESSSMMPVKEQEAPVEAFPKKVFHEGW